MLIDVVAVLMFVAIVAAILLKPVDHDGLLTVGVK